MHGSNSTVQGSSTVPNLQEEHDSTIGRIPTARYVDSKQRAPTDSADSRQQPTAKGDRAPRIPTAQLRWTSTATGYTASSHNSSDSGSGTSYSSTPVGESTGAMRAQPRAVLVTKQQRTSEQPESGTEQITAERAAMEAEVTAHET